MKVLQINVNCGRLSTGRICTDLAEVFIEELDLMAESGTLNFDFITVSADDWKRETPSQVTCGLVN